MFITYCQLFPVDKEFVFSQELREANYKIVEVSQKQEQMYVKQLSEIEVKPAVRLIDDAYRRSSPSLPRMNLAEFSNFCSLFLHETK